MPVAVPFLIAAAVGSSIYFGKEQMDAAGEAKDRQTGLEAQRRKELADQAAARDAARLRASESGKRVGARTSLTGGTIGFGSGNTTAGLGSGSLFGN